MIGINFAGAHRFKQALIDVAQALYPMPGVLIAGVYPLIEWFKRS